MYRLFRVMGPLKVIIVLLLFCIRFVPSQGSFTCGLDNPCTNESFNCSIKKPSPPWFVQLSPNFPGRPQCLKVSVLPGRLKTDFILTWRADEASISYLRGFYVQLLSTSSVSATTYEIKLNYNMTNLKECQLWVLRSIQFSIRCSYTGRSDITVYIQSIPQPGKSTEGIFTNATFPSQSRQSYGPEACASPVVFDRMNCAQNQRQTQVPLPTHSSSSTIRSTSKTNVTHSTHIKDRNQLQSTSTLKEYKSSTDTKPSIQTVGTVRMQSPRPPLGTDLLSTIIVIVVLIVAILIGVIIFCRFKFRKEMVCRSSYRSSTGSDSHILGRYDSSSNNFEAQRTKSQNIANNGMVDYYCTRDHKADGYKSQTQNEATSLDHKPQCSLCEHQTKSSQKSVHFSDCIDIPYRSSVYPPIEDSPRSSISSSFLEEQMLEINFNGTK